MKITRRNAIGVLATTAVAALEDQAAAQPAAPSGVRLRWLEGAPPALETGVTFGVPWPRGTVRREQTFSLTADGKALPLQTWPLAFWPDGTIKFSGFAAVAGPAASGAIVLSPGGSAASSNLANQTAAAIDIDTGRFKCRIPRRGAQLIESINAEGRIVARAGRLVCNLADEFTGSTRQVTLEQNGPIRAVVKIEGVHMGGGREWLPFIVRLYFYAGAESIRMVHTIIFDGDEQKDFIRGLGVVFDVPMREQVHNRHIRLSGEGDGLWSEPVQPITGRRPLQGASYADQLAGQRIANKETFTGAGQKLLTDWAVWDDFKLVQHTPDGFTIHKRTNPQSCWLDVIAGRRSSGLVFAGDVSGGLAVGVKNFWQSYPTSLEVRHATTDTANLHVWLWSPDAAPMDLRHYDTRAHDLDSSYEDVQPGYSTPHGVARTSELMLFPSGSVPTKADTAHQAEIAQRPPLLVCAPEHIHSTKVFGIWSLPDRSTPAKTRYEDQLDHAFEIYHKEQDQRRWYGFWNYGDVMHQHDGARHEWRYDIGGFAWDNTELGTDMFFWYTFLRTGRSDVFRMAEAMTRHTSEVDVYHLGRFAPLGSRHNVRHWGCGAKEPRISQAAYRRFYYYFTADERTGDLMRAVLNVDAKTVEIDPMRLASPVKEPLPYPGRVRGGPDWLAFIGNWMTEWERTGDTKWHDKIIAGMDSIAAMPFGFLTGPNQLYGYEPDTGKLHALEKKVGVYNLTDIMGGSEVVFELNTLIDHPGWKKAWEQYCRLYRAPESVVSQDTGTTGEDGQYSRPGRLSGYLYSLTKNKAYARKAWEGLARAPRLNPIALKGPDVVQPIDEVTGLSTNTVAQSSLELIEVLETCGDAMPE
jgi:hypothetical protein